MALFIHKPLELKFMQKHMLVGIVISIVSNVILNVFLIPQFGYRVAAYTTLASTVFYILYVLLINRITKTVVYE